MTTYQLRISRKALREVDRLPGNVRQRIRRTLADLTREPRPRAARPLTGELAGLWRLRLEDYRIIYAIDDDEVVVTVVSVARRSPTTYAGLD